MKTSLYLNGVFAFLVLAAACSKPSSNPAPAVAEAPAPAPEPTPPLPELEIPLKVEDPLLSAAWMQNLLKLASDPSRARLIKSRESALPEKWILNTDAWLVEPGSVYRLGLGPGAGSQDYRSWVRILKEVQSLIENPSPALPFRSTLKLILSANDSSSTRLKFAPLTRYVDIEVSAAAPQFERQACEKLQLWFSARQLLAGRSLKAQNRSKEDITLTCHLINWSESPKSLPFLQITELPLPLIEPETGEVLFRSSADLLRWDRLEPLRALAPLGDAI